MSELTHVVCALAAGSALGYFIPRSRNVVYRVDEPVETSTPARLAPAATALDHLPELTDLCVFVCDANGQILRVNPAAATFFGFDRAAVAGRAIIEVTGSVELERAVCEAVEGEVRRCTLTARHTGGVATLRAVIERSAPDAVLVILADATALVESERVRREFLANVSHELRTPLAGLKLMTETVQSDDDPETRGFFYPKIAREIDRMIELVEHLLQIARSETGRVAVQRAPTQLATLIGDILDTFGMRLGSRSVVAERRLEPIVLDTDAARLAQILVNLLENALRHTPSGGRITVTLRRDADDVLIEVADTGSGIPFRDLPHIFERFYVVDQSRAKQRGGLGVGLAIVKNNVEALGGRITVESEYGAGSCFAVRLPACEAQP